MKKLLFVSVWILIASHTFSQNKIDTLGDNSNSVIIFDAISSPDKNEFYATTRSSNLSSDFIIRFNSNLGILDTLPTPHYWSQNVFISKLFSFNNKSYLLASDVSGNNKTYLVYTIQSNQLLDSIHLSTSSLLNESVARIYQVSSDTLRLVINIWNSANTFITGGKIIDLDSNFQLINQYSIQQPLSTSKEIQSISTINDSLWHVHTVNTLYGYNPRSQTTEFSKLIEGRIFFQQHLSDSTYAGFGIVSAFERPPLKSTSIPSLGFYIFDLTGNPIDTVHFNSVSQYSASAGNWTYSNESASHRNSLFYDENNIYLASTSVHHNSSSSHQEEVFFVIKSDILGNEKWRFTIGGGTLTAGFTDIEKTADQGCLVTGYYSPDELKPFFHNSILIKLGPDGTISNVELDAPETVINFYPNPVKDKLYYNYLPEANGNYTLEIIDMQGKPVQEVVLDNQKGFIPVSLQSGFYLYHLKSENGRVEQVGRLVVE